MEEKLKKLQKIKGKEKVEPMLKSELQKLKETSRKVELEQQEDDIKSNIRMENKKRLMENKNPYFYKKREVNNMILTKKLDSMGSKGKVENYMNKKRREAEGRKAGIVKSIQSKKIKKMKSLEGTE